MTEIFFIKKNWLNQIKIFLIKKRILLGILAFASFFIFFRLTVHDMDTDGGFYSTWSVGYLDYLLSDGQTTPIQWLGYVPWWGRLSFHAHPPLVFLIFHIFFKIFGESQFVAQLPVALAGLGSVIFLYCIARRLYSEKIGLLSALILSISSYFIWISRVTYLEGVEIFFILLTSFVFFIIIKKPRLGALFSFLLGLTLLTKYSAIFLFPTFLLYVFLNKYLRSRVRFIFLNKYFFVCVLIFFLTLSPIIIYNIMMFRTRGHFDIQVARIIPIGYEEAKKDWPKLFEDSADLHISKNFLNTFRGIKDNYSPPLYWLLVVSLAWILGRPFIPAYRPERERDTFLICSAFSLFLLFMMMGPAPRYLPILLPFLSLAISVFMSDVLHYFSRFSKKIKATFIYIFGLIIILEIFFNINTNHLTNPLGKKGLLYSSYRIEDTGYNELEKYLVSAFKKDKNYISKAIKITSIKQVRITNSDLRGRNVYLFESGLRWFPGFWHLQRYFLYHNINITADSDFIDAVKDNQNWFLFLSSEGVENFYYIKGVDEKVFERNINNDFYKNKKSEIFEEQFKPYLEDRASVHNIYNSQGELAFKVYKIILKK